MKPWVPVAALGAFLLLTSGGRRERNADDIQSRAIPYFGGFDADPFAYPETREGFARYLRDVGVEHWTVEDIVIPKDSALDEMDEWGYDYLLPHRLWWPRGAALFLLADRIVDQLDGRRGAVMNYWWRPDCAPNVDVDPRPGGCFNEDLGGALQGDHPDAYAIDVKWGSSSDRAVAEETLEWLYDNAPWLELSYGVGSRLTHFGIGSRKGRRRWTY